MEVLAEVDDKGRNRRLSDRGGRNDCDVITPSKGSLGLNDEPTGHTQCVR